MRTTTLAAILLAATLLAWPLDGQAAPITLLDDQFAAQYLSGGEEPDLRVYSANDPPGSTEWYMSYPVARTAAESSVVYSPTTGMTLRDTGGGTSNFMGYFTENRSTFISLAVGESIKLTFDFTAKNPADVYNGFGFGLVNSHGTQVADGFYSGAVTAKPFDGYLVVSNFVNTGNWNTTLQHRNAGTYDALYASGSWDTDNMTGTYHTDGLDLVSETTYSGELTITRTGASENTIQFSMNNRTLNVTDTAPFTTFDSINFNFNTSASDSLTINNIKVVYTPVPEPGTAGLGLAAGAVLGWALLRRRGRS